MSNFKTLKNLHESAIALQGRLDTAEVNIGRLGAVDLKEVVDAVHDAKVDLQNAVDNLERARKLEKEARYGKE